MHCKKVPIGATIKYGSFIMGEGIIYKVSMQVTHKMMPQSLTNYLRGSLLCKWRSMGAGSELLGVCIHFVKRKFYDALLICRLCFERYCRAVHNAD